MLNCLSANPHRREKIEVATKHYELTTDAANGFAVVFAKVGDGLKSGANPKLPFAKGSQRSESVSSAPHELDVQARLGSFQFGRMKWHV